MGPSCWDSSLVISQSSVVDKKNPLGLMAHKLTELKMYRGVPGAKIGDDSVPESFITTQYFSINGITIQSHCFWTMRRCSAMLQVFQCENFKWSHLEEELLEMIKSHD